MPRVDKNQVGSNQLKKLYFMAWNYGWVMDRDDIASDISEATRKIENIYGRCRPKYSEFKKPFYPSPWRGVVFDAQRDLG